MGRGEKIVRYNAGKKGLDYYNAHLINHVPAKVELGPTQILIWNHSLSKIH
jgi:hypothetical protein